MNNMPYKGTLSEMFPDEWDIVPLGDVFKPITIRLKDVKGSAENIPILSMTRANGLVLQSEKFDKRVASRDTSNYKVVKNGQLVYGFPIDEGVIAILHRYPIGAVSPAYQVWEPIIDIDLSFIDFMLKTQLMINAYIRFSSNVVERRRNLAQRDFVRIPVPLPPLPEQRAIAHVLSTVRQAIEATERVIVAARELKRSMMKHLFTYGPVPVHEADQVPLKDTEIGEVPEGWDVSNLEYAVNLRKEIVLPEDYPHLRYVGLEHLESGENQIKTFGAASDVKSSKHRFYPSDNLYGKLRPYLDKCAQAEWEGMSSTDILILTPNEDILISGYLVNLMHTGSYLNYAKSTTSGTNLPRTSWSSMKKFQFGLPSLEEQVVSVNFLQRVGHKITLEENRKYALEYLFNSLLHNLMTGKVRVDYD